MKLLLPIFLALALVLILFCAITLPTHAQGPTPTPTSSRPALIRSAPSFTSTLYFPLINLALPNSCAAIPNQAYGSVAIVGASTTRPADQQADMNLALRGYTLTVPLSKTLVTYGGSTDPNAPQLANLFSPARLPSFANTYQVGKWDWGCNCKIGWDDQWDVELLGTGTSPAEIISTPASGYDIGFRPAGYEVMVLYATMQRITFTYGRYDSIVDPNGSGYAIHVEDICVEPSLLALYNSLNTQGRNRLPALFAHQPFGRARGSEIKVAIRDSGMFMDPRSRTDWWLGY